VAIVSRIGRGLRVSADRRAASGEMLEPREPRPLAPGFRSLGALLFPVTW
jgi:hypothetical protein